MKHLLFFGLLVGLVNCSKKEITPVIPANTLCLTVKGTQVTLPASSATVTLSNQRKRWTLTASALDAVNTRIAIGEMTSGPSMETPGTYLGTASTAYIGGAYSLYGYLVPAKLTTACGTTIAQGDYITYQTTDIPMGLSTTVPEFTLTIATVDTVAHTMSGTFAGTYWKGCDKLAITDGQFNLPYLVKP